MDTKAFSDQQIVYNIVSIQLNTNKLGVSLARLINGLTIINYGASVITVNQSIVLYPGTPGSVTGDSITFGGNKGEVYRGTIDIAFDSIIPGNNKCVILQKVYFTEFNDKL